MLASGRVPPVIFRFRCAAQVQACGLIWVTFFFIMKKRDKKTPHNCFRADTTGAFINKKKGQGNYQSAGFLKGTEGLVYVILCMLGNKVLSPCCNPVIVLDHKFLSFGGRLEIPISK
jgi:hypothetical protein